MCLCRNLGLLKESGQYSTLAPHLLMSFAIVVIINKAFKLFQLVLVVYCDSC